MFHFDLYFQCMLNNVCCMYGTEVCHHTDKIIKLYFNHSTNSTTETAECCEGFTNRSGICESKPGLFSVCLGFIVPLENFSLTRRHNYR